jgi:hypothetical protein
MRSLERGLAVVAALSVGFSARLSAQIARVSVSREQLRLAFAVDTARPLGWSQGRPATFLAGYSWAVSVSGMDGPKWIGFAVSRDSTTPRRFSSLAELVRAGRAEVCQGGMAVICDDSHTTASPAADSIVVIVRDSLEIRRLFILRPESLRFSIRLPDDSADGDRGARVGVNYVDPQIPIPTVSTRAEFAAARRRYEEGIHATSRSISGLGPAPDQFWLQTGDSVAVGLREERCTFDSCSELRSPPSDSGWSIADPRVARLQLPDSIKRGPLLVSSDPRFFLKALRPGRTALIVRGIHSPNDTAVSSSPPAVVLRREILVTAPVHGVRIVTHPDTVLLHKQFTVEVRAFGSNGRRVPNVPVVLTYGSGELRYAAITTGRARIQLDTTGVARLVARVMQIADSADLVVVPAGARAPRR